LTIELIEVLGQTVTPFVNPEKPQVFPEPAASFIRKGSIVCTSDTAVFEPCRRWRKQRQMTDKRMSLYILYFIAIPMPRNDGKR